MRKTAAIRAARETTRTCMLPLVIGGVSTRFFAGFACFFSLTGNRSNLYPFSVASTTARPLFRPGRSNAWSNPAAYTSVATLCSCLVAASSPTRPRVDDKGLEHLVDVTLARRVGDKDPVPLVEHVQIPERQPAVGSGETEPVAGDIDVRLPVPGVACPAEMHGGVFAECFIVVADGVGYCVVAYLGHLRNRHPQHLALRPPADDLLPGRRPVWVLSLRFSFLPLDGSVDLPRGHRESGLFGSRANLLGIRDFGLGVVLRGAEEEARGHHDSHANN